LIVLIEKVYRSVPGVGSISARVLANELGNIADRFPNQKAIYRYTGLTPSEYSSGEYVRKGRISRQGSPRVRHILTEVTWRAIRDDMTLKRKFERIAATRGKRKACVAIARNLIGRIRSCFVKGELYLPECA
jgi:transposase